MQIVISSTKGGSGKTTLCVALADILDADLIDHDPQGTIYVTSMYGGRHKPVQQGEVRKDIVIHDTPPYNIDTLSGLYAAADLILIPCKVSDADFLALKPVIEQLRKKGLSHKARIILNDIRKPHNNTYKKVKARFAENYTDIGRVETELTSLVGFSNVLSEPLKGQALEEMKRLAKDLGITLI